MIDAYRAGGTKQDADTISTLMAFHHLTENDAIDLSGDGKLSLPQLSVRGMVHAVQSMRAAAVAPTRKEIQSHNPAVVPSIYNLL